MMMSREQMPRTMAVRKSLQSIPQEKRSRMVARTLLGLMLAALGIYAKAFWPTLPDLVAFGTFGFGLVMASGQLMSHPFRLFVAMLRDVLGAIRGKE